MGTLLWLSLVGACAVSVVVFIANLKMASSTTEPQVGVVWLRLAWAVFLVLAAVNLVMMGAR